MTDIHQPVLLNEVIEYLAIKPNGIYIDATFGRGGHAKEILNRLGESGFLLAIDKDPDAIKFAQQQFEKEARLNIKQGSFTMLQTFTEELGLVGKVDGILLDLGVSSPQLDNPDRGFSFLQDGPLDMRMNPNVGMDAATWINNAKAPEIASVLKKYGDERYAKRIAAAIVREVDIAPITRTKRLAEIITKANPAWEKHKHPATRSFQAIRIFINRELEEIEACLAQCLCVLKGGGRLAVISFHSLEDRIVKAFVQKQERGGDLPRGLPVTQAQIHRTLKRIAWGVVANEDEVNANPRARSAILRVAEKIG